MVDVQSPGQGRVGADPDAHGEQDVPRYCAQVNFGPVARVLKEDDVEFWQCSQAYYELVAYINNTSTNIQGWRQHAEYPVSRIMRKLCQIFDKLEALLDMHPPIPREARRETQLQALSGHPLPMQQGNRAYRNWARSMQRQIFPFVERAIPQDKCQHVNELGQYLCKSFGNSTRIDYGTGHELSFMFFLCSLFRAEILKPKDLVAAALLLFPRYLEFVRRLQKIYNMESAGSHDAYSLDEYQFMPYLWGAAQLSYDAPFATRQLLDADVVAAYRREYLFMGCVAHIAEVKIGTFAMHSNQLWSIAAITSWSKMYKGLLDMYLKEVISEFQLVQHISFGKLMSFDAVKIGRELVGVRLGSLPRSRRRADEDTDEEEMVQVDDELGNGPAKKATSKLPSLSSSTSLYSHSVLTPGLTSTSLSGTSIKFRSLAKMQVTAEPNSDLSSGTNTTSSHAFSLSNGRNSDHLGSNSLQSEQSLTRFGFISRANKDNHRDIKFRSMLIVEEKEVSSD